MTCFCKYQITQQILLLYCPTFHKLIYFMDFALDTRLHVYSIDVYKNKVQQFIFFHFWTMQKGMEREENKYTRGARRHLDGESGHNLLKPV